MGPDVEPLSGERNALLRQRLSLLCHFIRWVGVVWIAWALLSILQYFGDRATVAANYGRLFGRDLSGLPASDHLAALVMLVADWAVAALMVFFVWRLFGHYLAGRIFSVEAANALRCMGLAGVAAVSADILTRPLMAALLTRHLSDGRSINIWTEPNDLLHLLMALFILALAHVFKTGVEIAEEHRQIV